MSKIENAVSFMLNVANDDSHGYDQTHRNGPNYDCSSLIGTALKNAGFNVNPASTTRNLRSQLVANGFKSIDVNSDRKRGDIFLKEGKHVVMCTSATNIVHASINEKGTTTGGKSGDQTGKEICTRSFYTIKGGWDYHFRLEEAGKPIASNGNDIIRIGQAHANNFVGAGLELDGIRGYKTVKGAKKVLQHAINLDYNAGLAIDGDWGPKSSKALGSHYVKRYETQYMVTALEILLMLKGYDPQGVECPGVFGSGLEACVKQYQRDHNLKVDGIAGKNTFKSLIGV